jgi:hypothetical protein
MDKQEKVLIFVNGYRFQIFSLLGMVLQLKLSSDRQTVNRHAFFE